MEEAQVLQEKTLKTFFSDLLRPKKFQSLMDPVYYEVITVSIFRSSEDPIELEFEYAFDPIYPFYTVRDLALKIYDAMSGEANQEDYAPDSMCLLMPLANEPRKYTHLRYLFERTKPILDNPFDFFAARKGRSLFIQADDQPKDVLVESLDKCLLEDTLFLKKHRQSSHTIHVFLYKDLLSAYQGPRPISFRDWHLFFKLYFPEMPLNASGILTESEQELLNLQVKRFQSRDRITKVLDEKLKANSEYIGPGNSAEGDALLLNNFKSLRFGWNQPLRFLKNRPLYKKFRLDTLFFSFPVSRLIPYVRMFGKQGSPITKVFVDGPFNEPAMQKPEVLLQWTKEKSPKPNSDVLIAKILIREAAGVLNPLYATLTIFEDASAFIAIQPNKDTRNLSAIADLSQLSELMESVLEQIPKLESTQRDLAPVKIYREQDLELFDCYAILESSGYKESPVLTQQYVFKMLPFYRAFFQITSSPIKEVNPIAFLRYKLVNNFSTPSRDFAFLYRVDQLQKQAGVLDYKALMQYYREEFDVGEDIANERVSQYIEQRGELQAVDTELTLKFEQTQNPGIDINIFSKQHPNYIFHIYRAETITTLRRIKSLLTLLMNLNPQELQDVRDSASELTDEQRDDETAAENEAMDELTGSFVAAESVKPALQASIDAAGSGDDEEDTFALLTGGPRLDQFMEDEAPPSGEDFEEAPAPEPEATTLAELVREDAPSAAKPTKSSAPKKKKVGESDFIEDKTELLLESTKSYFRKRLQYYDRILFAYKPTATVEAYPEKCQANAVKQPAIMSEEEFIRMKKLYASDNVLFIEYPLTSESEKPKPKDANTEIIGVLRYSSSQLPGQMNVLLCSEFWCKTDEIVVLKQDFYSSTDRKGNPKPKQTCPFCKQGPIKNRSVAVPGESVIVRESTAKKKHLHIGFLTKSLSPDGLYLPCCFISEKVLTKMNHPAFKARDIAVQKAIVEAEQPRAAPQEVLARKVARIPIKQKEDLPLQRIDFSKMYAINKLTDIPYIVGSEKIPLIIEGSSPQLGVVPKPVDSYFAQDSYKYLVKQDHTVWKLMTDTFTNLPNASGFFRMATDNRQEFLAESFLAALAPYYGASSTADMKRKLLDILRPKIFLSMNYGNFLFEFYDPNVKPDKKYQLSKEFLGIQYGRDQDVWNRLENAWYNFEAYMANSKKLKQYRHFAQFLATPGFLTYTSQDQSRILYNGILFIVLEVNQKNEVTVRCPPFGVSEAMANKADVAFLLHYWSGVWEPLFYTRNDPNENVFENTLIFTQETREAWPPIVQQRFQEYTEMCKRSGLGIYTDSPFVKPDVLVPVSSFRRFAKQVPLYGLLRDTYNHISAVLYRGKSGGLILVPSIDDGGIYDLNVELSWRGITEKLATADEVQEFYTTQLKDLLPSFYTIKRQIRLDKTVPEQADISVLQLAGGLFVPVKKSDVLPVTLESEIGEANLLTWVQDTKLVFGSQEASLSEQMEFSDFQEIYQQFRLSVSNWLAISPTVKKAVEQIILFQGRTNTQYSVEEKRRKLFTLLGYELLSWLDSSLPTRDRTPSLKRIDCHVITHSDACTNQCVWQEEASRCLLHVPETYEVGMQKVDAKIVMVLRVLEELIRFPLRRMELLMNDVSQYKKLTEPFRSGNEYVIPEQLPAWTEYLRMDWRKTTEEKPRFYEEFGDAPDIQLAEPLVPLTTQTLVAQPKVPEPLKTFLTPAAMVFFTIDPATPLAQVLATVCNKPDLVNDLRKKGLAPVGKIFPNKVIAEFVAESCSMSILQLVYQPGDESGANHRDLLVKLPTPGQPGRYQPVLILVQLPNQQRGLVSFTNTLPYQPCDYVALPPNLKRLFMREPAYKPKVVQESS